MRRTDIKLYVLIAFLLGSIFAVHSCDNPEDPVDTESPVIAITSPANNSEVPNTVDVVAEATDNEGVVKVEFYVDAQLYATDNVAPWSCLWSAGTDGAGEHDIFARAFDAAGNTDNSDLVVVTCEADPPAAISDLSATDPNLSGEVTLSWTAVGEDGMTGTATAYEIRCYWMEITLDNWQSATVMADPPTPQEAGSSESYDVTGLSLSRTYYFAVRAQDASGNWSDISNNVVVTTPSLLQDGLSFDIGPDASGLVVGDFDNDSDPDLIISHRTETDNLSVLLNDGAGNFAAPVVYTARWNPTDVNTGDFDGDGDLDLVVTSWDTEVEVEEPDGDTVLFEESVVSILLNNGDATFELQEFITSDTVGYIWCEMPYIYIPELPCMQYSSVVHDTPNNEYDILLIDEIVDNYTAGENSTSVYCEDFDGDGFIDLAITNSTTSNISIMFNYGDGTFMDPVNYGTLQSRPSKVCAADFNGDGFADLANANAGPDKATMFLNLQDGTFGVPVSRDIGDEPTDVCADDFDGDGDIDLAFGNSRDAFVSILFNQGNGTFTTTRDYQAGSGAGALTSGDLDGDGAPELIVAGFTGDNVTVMFNEGLFLYYSFNSEQFPVGDGPNEIECFDVDGDGDNDIVVVNANGQTVSILLNRTVE